MKRAAMLLMCLLLVVALGQTAFSADTTKSAPRVVATAPVAAKLALLPENAKGFVLPNLSAAARQYNEESYRRLRQLELRGAEKVQFQGYLQMNPSYLRPAQFVSRRAFVSAELEKALVSSAPSVQRPTSLVTQLSENRVLLKYKLVDMRVVEVLRRYHPNGLVDIFVPKALYETPTPFDIEIESGGQKHVTETGLTVKAAVDRYVRDLEAGGYMAKLYVVEGGNHVNLRQAMQADQAHALVGAVMIGSGLPIAWFDMPNDFHGRAQFPVDLFFMDLDGNWADTDGDGMYENHTGDVAPEVWLGRIVGNLPVTGKPEARLVAEYLSRNHFFRIQHMTKFPQRLFSWSGDKPHYRGLAYQDDDWTDPAESQYLAGQVTHERILVNTSTTTNAADYLGRIPQGFFYIHQMIHSGPTSLDFKTGASWNPDSVTISELNATARRAHFYNLFDCSAARFVENNFLAGMYAVATPYGLGAVGSTKTGAMGVFDVYYSNLMGVLRPEDAAFVSDWDVVLGRQQTFGTAFLKWFRYIAKDGFTLGEKQWHYGMTYIGDPTLYNDWLLNKGRV